MTDGPAKTSPEKMAKIKKWRAANPEKVAAAQRRWRERHPEQHRAAQRAWAEANREYPTAYYRENPTRAAEYMRRYRAAHPDRAVEQQFRQRAKRYGLTANELRVLIDEQGDACAICGTPPTPGRGLCVDHCHTTGVVRGLLCSRCNRDIDRLAPHLSRLVAYLS